MAIKLFSQKNCSIAYSHRELSIVQQLHDCTIPVFCGNLYFQLPIYITDKLTSLLTLAIFVAITPFCSEFVTKFAII